MGSEVKQIVIVGAGDWVKKQYMPALKPYLERGECRVYILYKYAPPEGNEQYNQFVRDNVTEFEKLGADCLNVDVPEDMNRIKNVSPDVVFVVSSDDTHCDVAEEWLDRAALIIVEKPFDIDSERIRQLRMKMADKDNVWGFDHYLVRANQFRKMRAYLGFDEHMEKQIHEFRFHMLESTDRGMVERSASIQRGMILDMGSHTPALVLPFGEPNTIRLDAVKAGIYAPNPAEGINTSGREIMRSGMETFAEIQFTFTSIFGQEVKATACFGKAVDKEDEKYVEVVGGSNRDRRVRLDLSNFIVDFTHGEETRAVTSLFPNSVHLLVREVMAERALSSLALFRPEVGQDIIARLNEWRRPVENYVKAGRQLQGYVARTPLECILNSLDPL